MWPGAAGPSPAGLPGQPPVAPVTLVRTLLVHARVRLRRVSLARREEVELLGAHEVGEAPGVVGPVVLPAGEPPEDVHLLALPAVGHRCVHVVAPQVDLEVVGVRRLVIVVTGPDRHPEPGVGDAVVLVVALPTPYFRSRMAFSIWAWRRWSASSSSISPSRSVMKP